MIIRVILIALVLVLIGLIMILMVRKNRYYKQFKTIREKPGSTGRFRKPYKMEWAWAWIVLPILDTGGTREEQKLIDKMNQCTYSFYGCIILLIVLQAMNR